MNENGQVIQIPIEDIIPNRAQPRISFDQKALESLAKSIKQHGIIQPLVVRKLADKYEIIAGERRYKAATLAGLVSVPAIVSEMSDQESAEVALIENVQRENLSAIEEARSYKNILDNGDLTQEDLAKKMGLSQSAVANKMRLLNLPDEVQKAVLDGKISERHARSLLQVDDPQEQKKLLDRVIDERLTVRQLDTIIKQLNNDDEEEDVPLVDINQNLDKIVSEATDIAKPFNSSPSTYSDDNVIPSQNEVQESYNPDGHKNRFFNFDISEEQETDNYNAPTSDSSQSHESFFDFVSSSPSDDLANLANDSTLVSPNNNDVSEELLDLDTPIIDEASMTEPVTDIIQPDYIESLDDEPELFMTETPTVEKSNKIKNFINNMADNNIEVTEQDEDDSHIITIKIKKGLDE